MGLVSKGRTRKGCGNPRQQVTAMRDGLGKYVCSTHQQKRKQHASKHLQGSSYARKHVCITAGSSRVCPLFRYLHSAKIDEYKILRPNILLDSKTGVVGL